MKSTRVVKVSSKVNDLNVVYTGDYFIYDVEEEESINTVALTISLLNGNDYNVNFEIKKNDGTEKKKIVVDRLGNDNDEKTSFTIYYDSRKSITSLTRKPIKLFSVLVGDDEKEYEQIYINYILQPLSISSMLLKVIVLSEVLSDE